MRKCVLEAAICTLFTLVLAFGAISCGDNNIPEDEIGENATLNHDNQSGNHEDNTNQSNNLQNDNSSTNGNENHLDENNQSDGNQDSNQTVNNSDSEYNEDQNNIQNGHLNGDQNSDQNNLNGNLNDNQSENGDISDNGTLSNNNSNASNNSNNSNSNNSTNGDINNSDNNSVPDIEPDINADANNSSSNGQDNPNNNDGNDETPTTQYDHVGFASSQKWALYSLDQRSKDVWYYHAYKDTEYPTDKVEVSIWEHYNAPTTPGEYSINQSDMTYEDCGFCVRIGLNCELDPSTQADVCQRWFMPIMSGSYNINSLGKEEGSSFELRLIDTELQEVYIESTDSSISTTPVADGENWFFKEYIISEQITMPSNNLDDGSYYDDGGYYDDGYGDDGSYDDGGYYDDGYGDDGSYNDGGYYDDDCYGST